MNYVPVGMLSIISSAVDTVTLWEAVMIKTLITERLCAISINTVHTIEEKLQPNKLRMRLEMGLLNSVNENNAPNSLAKIHRAISYKVFWYLNHIKLRLN